nr:sigma-E processing peptidase SpoIIGA [uncultured Caproiciproducens sp.]
MKQKIYIDILVGVNLFINYFLLLAVSRFLSLTVKRPRLAAAAALGAIASLSILLPEINLFLSFFLKLVLSALIILFAYPFFGLKQFLRELASFYIMSFAFAGFMLALWYFIAPQGLIIKNSIVYFNVSPLLLIVLTVVCYFTIRLIHRITGRQAPENLFCRIQIDFNGKSVFCSAKVDTGNTLTEPFSNAPVVVVCEECIAELTPRQESGKIRLVPFQAVSGGGLLPAFKPDKLTVIIGKDKIEIHEVYIAVTKANLGAFSALLNPDLLQKTSA